MTQPSNSTPQKVDLANLSPSQVNDLHRYDDVDNSPEAHHHTLGLDINQAAPGGHTHNGRDSRLLDLSGYAADQHTHDDAYVNEEDHTKQQHVDLGLSASDHAHNANLVAFSPVGAIAATNVQAAIAELDTEKAAVNHTQAATTVTVSTITGISATNVQAALAELQAEKHPLITPVDVTGSRGGNAALASLLTALDGLNIINDNTTA